MWRFLRCKPSRLFPARVTTFFTKIFFKNPWRKTSFFRRRIYCLKMNFFLLNRKKFNSKKMWRFLRCDPSRLFPARVTTFFTKFFSKIRRTKRLFPSTNLLLKIKNFFIEHKKFNSKKIVDIFKKLRVLDFFEKKSVALNVFFR